MVEQEQQHQISEREIRFCKRCNKEILPGDLAIEKVKTYRSRYISYTEEFFHKTCLEELHKESEEKEREAKLARSKKRKKLSIGLGIAAGVLGFVIPLIVFLVGAYINPGLAILFSFIISYSLFAATYCIICESYIADVFLSVASWSIKFPGLIFTWDIDGFAWFIAMKILFAILGALISLSVIALAVAISAFLGVFSFPFVLIHNIRHGYDVD